VNQKGKAESLELKGGTIQPHAYLNQANTTLVICYPIIPTAHSITNKIKKNETKNKKKKKTKKKIIQITTNLNCLF